METHTQTHTATYSHIHTMGIKTNTGTQIHTDKQRDKRRPIQTYREIETERITYNATCRQPDIPERYTEIQVYKQSQTHPQSQKQKIQRQTHTHKNRQADNGSQTET